MPRPEISWYTPHGPIDPNDFRYRVLHDGRLAIPITRREDGGVYMCVAENQAGKDSFNTTVKVHVPASILDSERYATAVQGSSVLLDCVVDGWPQPTITWQKDFLTLPNNEKYQLLANGSLLVNDVKVCCKNYSL